MLKSVNGSNTVELKAIVFLNIQGGKTIVGKYSETKVTDKRVQITLVDAVEMLSMVNPQGGVMIVGLALGDYRIITNRENIAVIDVHKKSCYWGPYYGVTSGISVA